jgi:hypothetical protein
MHNGKEEFLEAIRRHQHEVDLGKNSPLGNQLYMNPIDFKEGLPDRMITPPFTEPEKFRHLMSGLITILQPGWKINSGVYNNNGSLNGHELILFITHTDKKALLEEPPSDSIIKPEELANFPEDEEVYMGQSRLGRALDSYMRGTNLLVDKTFERAHKMHSPQNQRLGLFRHDKKEYIEMYQQGVRDIGLRLIRISTLIDTIHKSVINNPTDIYAVEAAKRINELTSWMVDDPMPVFSYQNMKPVPEEFVRDFEKLRK